MKSEELVFYVWITLLSPTYAEAIVGRLVRRNWRVAALGNQLVLSNSDNPATLLAFSASYTVEGEGEVTYSTVLDEVNDVLKQLRVKFMSLIVADAAGSTWNIGNMSFAEQEKLIEAKKKGVN